MKVDLYPRYNVGDLGLQINIICTCINEILCQSSGVARSNAFIHQYMYTWIHIHDFYECSVMYSVCGAIPSLYPHWHT